MNTISVCMATYNGEKYVHRQLESILAQLNDEDEVIISDDRSTDKTLSIIEKFNDRRIRVDVNKGKRGPMGNFEQAIMRSSGDFIVMADQDDEWLPNKISVLRSMLKRKDLVLSDCKVVNLRGEIIFPSFFSHRGTRTGFWYNLYKNSYMGCCMAFRREVLEYVLPFPPKIHMHDWWIGLLVEAKGIVCFYPEPLIYYIRHGNNASPTGEVGYCLAKRLKNRIYLLWYIAKRLRYTF